MTSIRDIFLDKELKTGGFYELSIQVCQSSNNEPIQLYTKSIWSLKNVDGPFDVNFNLIPYNVENTQHNGILQLENYSIPFMTYNIREEELVETGFNWFDICFYTTAIEKIFGSEYQTWTENPKVPKLLSDFLINTVNNLHHLFPFKLAIIDFEVSGQYYLNDLKENLNQSYITSKFYVGEENFEKIANENKKIVTKIEKKE